MTPDERSLIDGLFDRLDGAAGQPRDADAEALIARRVQRAPYAPYALAQTVLVQDHALQQAHARIQELEEQVSRQAQPAPAPASSGSFLGGLLGGRGTSVPSTGNRGMALPQPQPQPQPQQAQPLPGGYTAPGYQQGAGYTSPGYPQGGVPQGGFPQQAASGPWAQQRSGFGGGGFLQGALTTAAGVAGGALLYDGIRNLMSGGSGPIAEQAALIEPVEALPSGGDLGQQAQDALGGNPWGAGGQDAPVQDAGFVDDGSQDASVQDASYDDGGWDAGGDDSSWA